MNQWPNYIYPYSWYSSTDNSPEKLYQTFFNCTCNQQETNPSYFIGQYPNQISSYQPIPTVTASSMLSTPSVYNNFTTTAYGYPYYGYQNNTISNIVYQNSASTNLWNQAAASIGQSANQATASIDQSASALLQNATAVPNAFGQTTLFHGNTSNPFRLSTPICPTPPPRLRRQRINCAKVIKKKSTAPKKTFMQLFLEANQPKHPAAPKPNKNKKLAPADVFFARAPEPFETPGECPIEKIKNENFVRDVQYGQNDGVGGFGSEEASTVIDIEN
uniref:Uncharacterized protein n=1 Tax=Panagrolaimus sp. PS1159 TaxID=55785 RepID=A0AC35GRV2_9BILA